MHRGTWPRLYVDLLRRAAEEGYTRPSREGETIELGPAIVSCPAPVFMELTGRAGSAEFARLEQLCYLGGWDPEPLLRVAPHYDRFRSDDGRWLGAYGPRLYGPMLQVVRELSRHPFSRRGVALIWRANDIDLVLDGNPKDVPCTISLTFWCGPAGELRCQAHMRSCDLWFGLYYDLPAFAFLQRCIAKALKRGVGQTYLNASSLHLYSKDLKRASSVKPAPLNEVRVHSLIPEPLVSDLDGPGRFEWLQVWARTQLKEATT
jgi:Thymidylate synthase